MPLGPGIGGERWANPRGPCAPALSTPRQVSIFFQLQFIFRLIHLATPNSPYYSIRGEPGRAGRKLHTSSADCSDEVPRALNPGSDSLVLVLATRPPGPRLEVSKTF